VTAICLYLPRPLLPLVLAVLMSVPAVAGAQTLSGRLASKQCTEHAFVVAPGVSRITITLTLPGITGINRHGTTDFDLRVTDPLGRKTGGWSCDSSQAPTEIPGAAYHGLSASPESVLIRSAPSPGQWTVSVWSQLGSGPYVVSIDQGVVPR
jgi:hypothetical protein